ncbi:adenylate/guanylate cyclase domain-containing protein [Gordonia sp. VNK21]|uniref:adenylate/guanylate cyclase domain-containing protein n=1 Tax=Gordonia sp. VNK21 TaxID=3382483 RepID=UPI0038D4766A
MRDDDSRPASGERIYTRDDLIEALGLDSEVALRLWGAFGFPEGPDTGSEFSDQDLESLRAFLGKSSAANPASQLAAARSLGQATARLAEWQAEQIRLMAADPETGMTEQELADAVGRLQQLVWRRHLDDRLARHAESGETEAIVGFADIVGFTSLSRRLRLPELEDLIEAFESAAQQIVNGRGGQVIKNIGDAVMFTAPTPAQAAAIALDLHDLTSDGVMPTLRIGMAEGVALIRMGDLFGEPVNIAARLASNAREGTTLVDQNLADALADDEDVRVRHVPALSVRGYRRLRASALVRAHRTGETR